MLSASANTLHPAFFNRTPDRVLTASSSIPEDRQLSREQLRVSSYQEPPLAVGQYTLSVSQRIEVFDNNLNQNISKDLASPDTQLRVSSPRFQLTDPQLDIHSVYPASGHSDHAQTLAHVVFRRCTTPWERRLVNDKGEWDNCGMNNNRMPWLGVLSFTEDELVLDEAKCHAVGFTDAASRPSSQGTITTTASHLENLTGVVSPLSGNAGLPNDDKGYAARDEANVLLMNRSLFQGLFASYNTARESPFKPDLTRFSRMAHVRETHAGFMASTVNLMSNSGAGPNPQPQYSVVVSPRTGPPGEDKPRRVISHLVSLDGVSRMTSDLEPQAEYAALISLFSWDWMCVPNDHVDFRNIMATLGNNVHPLRIDIPEDYKKHLHEAEQKFKTGEGDDKPAIPDEKTENTGISPRPEQGGSTILGQEKAERNPMADWLQQKTHAGYTMKPHTLSTGEITRALLRGPFIPVAPARDSINCFSATGEDLVLVDSETGIKDVSYKVAWHLGRALAMGDRSLMAALLRFRGRVHAEAVKRLKARKAVNAKAGSNESDLANGVFTMAAAFATLDDSISQLEKASDMSILEQLGGQSRWLRTDDEKKDSLVSRLSLASAPLKLDGDDYAEELRVVVNAFFGYPPTEPDSKPEIPPIAQRDIDPDAVLIRAWAVDKLYLAGIPLHNLLPDPDMLPRESIRTFCVDPKWLDAAIDGGLSTANHFARGDDAVRQAIKKCLNRYMGQVRTHGPGKGTTLQLPKWGFLLRSVAVTAFPDLKVEAQFGKAVPDGIREVLYMQVLADDILLCLFDRMPGDENFKEICISQPSHQQSFAAGSKLTNTFLNGWFRPIPRVPMSSVPEDEQDMVRRMLLPIERRCELGNDSEPVYDWDVRMIRPDTLSKKYVAAVAAPERDETKVWKWTGAAEDVPSAVLALQLGAANFQLTLPLDRGGLFSGDDGDDDDGDRWTKPGVQLDAEPRAKALTTSIRKPASASVARTAGKQRQKIAVENLEWVPLPKNASSSITTAAMVVASDEAMPRHNITAQGLQQQDTNVVILPHVSHDEKTTWCPWPSKAACFSLFDADWHNETSPDWRAGSSTVVALRGPMDLVFALRQTPRDSDSGGKYPERLEVRIPVVLSQERTSGGDGEETKPLLIIPGTAEAPVLPKVEGLNGSGLWSYKTSLVVGSLFYPPRDGANKGDALQAYPNRCLLLVITARPRFGKGRMKDAFFDGSFMLHQARVVQPAYATPYATPYATQFDISWEQNVAYPRQVILERGIMLKIGEPSYLEIFNREKVCLNLTVHTSSVLGPTDRVIWEAEMRTATEQLSERFSLSPGDLCQFTASGQKHDYNFREWAKKGPITVRLYAESASGRRLGPKTPPMTFPRSSLPDYPGQIIFTFSYAGIYATWNTPANLPEISGTDKPYQVRFSFGQGTPVDADVEASKAFLEKGVHIATSEFAPEKTVRISHQLRIESKRVKGVVEERTNDFAVLHLSTSAQSAILAPLDLSAAPLVHPRSQFATWAKTSEIWYVADDHSIVGVRCRRKPQENTTLSSVVKIIQEQGEAKSVGTLAMFPQDSSFSKHTIAWVQSDGRLNGVERTVSDVHDAPNHDWRPVYSLYGMGYYTGVAPGHGMGFWTDIVHSLGAMAVSRTYDKMLHMLWAGPKGDLRMTFSEIDGPWGGRPEWPFTAIPIAGHIPQVIQGDGEVAVDVSRAIFASGHPGCSPQHFFWVTRGGGIKWMRFFHITEPKILSGFSISRPPDDFVEPEILNATDDARIADGGGSYSGCGPVTLTTRFAGRRRLFIFWVDGQEGRIWGKSADVDDLLGLRHWTPKFCVTPKGPGWPVAPAHPSASRLTVIAKDQDSFGPEGLVSAEQKDGGHGIYLLWFDQEGRLRAARTTDDHSYKEWIECILPDDVVRDVRTYPPPKENDSGRKMEVVVLRSTDGSAPNANVYDLMWVDKDGCLKDIGVEIQSAWSQ